MTQELKDRLYYRGKEKESIQEYIERVAEDLNVTYEVYMALKVMFETGRLKGQEDMLRGSNVMGTAIFDKIIIDDSIECDDTRYKPYKP